MGPFRNGGIGTAYSTLAESLARRGHEVTLLFLRGDYCENRSMSHWIEHYAERGVELVPLPDPESLRLHGGHEAATSYRAYAWLRSRHFDVVHFPELGGFGYYTLVAKRQGLAFAGTTVCIGTHSPIRWIRESNQELPHGLSDLQMEFLERESVALADVVVSPSHYMLSWMRDHDWTLPAEHYVQQNILPSSARSVEHLGELAPAAVRELVFFGRLETRKGLELFADALDAIDATAVPDFEVTFLGRPARVAGRDSDDYIASRARSWPWRHRVVSNLDQPEAMAFLREPGRVAVIPSFIENSPYTVLECLGAGIPFLAASVGGIAELVADDDLAASTFPPTPDELRDRIERALSSGLSPARPAVSFETTESDWIGWHESRAAASTPEREPEADPSVSVLSLGTPTESSDASDAPFLLVVGPSCTSAPEAAEILGRAALRTGADIVTSFADLEIASRSDARDATIDRRLYLGNAADVGLFDDVMGGPHFLIRRDALTRLGERDALTRLGERHAVTRLGEPGLSADGTRAFFARASLAGCEIAVVPEALYRQRVDPAHFDSGRGRRTTMRPYLESLPRELAAFANYAESLHRAPEPSHASEETDVSSLTALELLVRAADVLRARGAVEDARRVLSRGAQLAQRSGGAGDAVAFLLGAARVLVELDSRPDAIEHLAAAIQVASRADEVELFLRTLIDAGTHLAKLDENDAALAALVTARELAERHALDREKLSATIANGWARGRAGHPEEAQRTIEEALTASRALTNKDGVAELHLDGGERLADLGLDTPSRETFATAGRLAWQSGRPELVALARERLRATWRGEAAP